jgi:Cu/Ag efflux protein CusF
MLKQAAILLATLAISACVEDSAVSSTDTEKKNAAALKEATKAAIVIQTYEVEENKVTPAHKSSGAGGAER